MITKLTQEFKKCKVITLDSKLHSNIVSSKWGLIPVDDEHKILSDDAKFINIYILSNDTPQESDLCIEKTGLGYLKPFQMKREDLLIDDFVKRCKKIIASTDKKLTNIAQLHKTFVLQYLNNINRNISVDDILVEYEANETLRHWAKIELNSNYGSLSLRKTEEQLNLLYAINRNAIRVKIDADNTINVKLIKDTYTKAEYECGLREAFRAGKKFRSQNKVKIHEYNSPDEDEWIENRV